MERICEYDANIARSRSRSDRSGSHKVCFDYSDRLHYDRNTYIDQRFVIGFQDSVGHLKDRVIEELPEVQQTLAANPT